MSTSFFDDDDDGNTQDTRHVDEDSLPLAGPSRARARPAGGPSRQLQQRASTSVAPPPNAAVTARQREKSRARSAFPDGDIEMEVDDLNNIIGNNGDNDETDIEKMMRYWMDERMAPELLENKEELVNSLMVRLEAQTEAANLLASSAASKPEEHERILLVQMEIERLRYLLRAYIRARTYKVETFAQYLLRTPAAKRKMTDVEYGYAQRYQALIEKHYTNAVVQNLPERLGRLDEEEMVIRPDLDQAVFACARKDCPPVRLPDGQSLEMRKGEIHMLRYRTVRRLLKDGDVKLV